MECRETRFTNKLDSFESENVEGKRDADVPVRGTKCAITKWVMQRARESGSTTDGTVNRAAQAAQSSQAAQPASGQETRYSGRP
uniref:Uncharacterized protein n=1 Tax=Vespula pensylvanica TaxID=30213 RepID=A0A834NXC2_VESPE|nr:hypothetical protein H0235_010251 [Vespula pensylvanica]